MKLAFIMMASGVLGGISGACGLGWVNDEGFNIFGAVINMIGIIAIVIAANGIWRLGNDRIRGVGTGAVEMLRSRYHVL